MNKLWALILIILVTGFANAAQMETGLEVKLNNSSPGDFLDVSIQVARPGLDEALAPVYGMSAVKRRESAVEILRRYSYTAQASILEILKAYENDGDVMKVQRSYLGGTISFSGKPLVIREIAERTDILRIIDNSPQKVIQYNPARSPFARPTEPMGITWSVDTVNANTAWTTGFYGNGVIVGILDSGVRYTHVDLTSHMWQNEDEVENGIDDDYNGYIDDIYGYDFVNDDGNPADDNGHGTSCAGLVAGNGTASDTTGVAPEANVMALKVINSSGSGMPSDAIYAIEYGIDNGAHLFSMSLGWEDPSNTLKDWFRDNFEDTYSAGVVVITSAGNAGGDYPVPQSMCAPGDCPSPSQTGASSNTAIVSVGATNWWNFIASFSSRGPTHWDTDAYSDFPWPPGLIKPELCAPGHQVTTTSYSSDYGITYSFGGTSASAPIVAGAVALALSKNPALTPEGIDTLLQNTSLDLGPAGHDTAYGAGRLDCYNLITNVPIPSYPIIRLQSYETDDSPPTGDGSGIFDSGENVKLIVDIKNVGAPSTVNGAIFALGDPNISVVDGISSWGSIGTGVSADNTSDPFVISSDGLTPPGYTADIELTLTASGETYVETLEVSVGQYPHETADHTTPTISTSITNFGSFGFLDPSSPSPIGNGFQYNGTQTLYGGGFFLRLAYDNVITWENGLSSEFIPLMEIEPGGCPGGDCYYTAYINPNPLIKVAQESHTFDSAPNQDFIIYRLFVNNYSETDFGEVCLGFYLDFDIHVETGPTWYDRAQWVPAEDWGYMWETGSSPVFSGYVGIVGLESIDYGSVVENSVYVYPDGMEWDDTVKSNFMTGDFSESDGSPEADWSLIASSGPHTLNSGGWFSWAVAVVAGDNLSDWEDNADQAISAYSTLDISDNRKPKDYSVAVIPNPFNSSCLIEAPGNASTKIYDLNGRMVRVIKLENGTGKWNTEDANGNELPSGIYLVKPDITGEIAKAILIR